MNHVGPQRPLANTAPPILSARGVVKTYRSDTHDVAALRGIDLDVHVGELVTVMGPSGNGRTTLLNCLSGLDDIDAGSVTVDGADLFAMSDADRTRHRATRMGFVFQAFNLILVLSAAENVELPLLIIGVAPKAARKRARDVLGRVGLARRADHRPGELSGGEQQRVTVARALVGEPALVWADAPTGALDSRTAGLGVVMVRAVRERRHGIAMLRAMGASSRLVRSAMLIEAGLIVVQGTVIGVLLGLATTRQLLGVTDQNLAVTVPWVGLALIVAVPLVASLAATAWPAARSTIRPGATPRAARTLAVPGPRQPPTHRARPVLRAPAHAASAGSSPRGRQHLLLGMGEAAARRSAELLLADEAHGS